MIDDATKRLLYAQLWPEETTAAVLSALRAILETFGLPMALYTDRAGWGASSRRTGRPGCGVLPGLRRWQVGDQEVRALVPVERLPQVAP